MIRTRAKRLRISRRLGVVSGLLSLLCLALFPGLASAYSQSPGSSFTSQSYTTSPSNQGTANKTSFEVFDTCVDSVFDWRQTGDNHYDARVVRQCDTGSVTYTIWSYAGLSQVGVNKAGGCRFAAVAANGSGGVINSCEWSVNTEGNTHGTCGPSIMYNACYVHKGGSTVFWSGGTPTSPNS